MQTASSPRRTHRKMVSPTCSWIRCITGSAASRSSKRETTLRPSRKS
jgi:hypothetical protein